MKSLLMYLGGLTFSSKKGHLCVPNQMARRVITNSLLRHFEVVHNKDLTWCVRDFIEHHKLGPLCNLVEQNLQKVTSSKAQYAYNELALQVYFCTLLHSQISHPQAEVEVTKVVHNPGSVGVEVEVTKPKIGYIDLEVMAASTKELHIFEFKNKNEQFLDLGGVDLANCTEAELLEVKVAKQDKYHSGELISKLMENATIQVLQYREGKKKISEASLKIICHVVMCIGAKRVIHHTIFGMWLFWVVFNLPAY